MPSTVTLVALPKSLRKGIDRRLPRGWIKDQTGKKFGAKTVIGFAGFRDNFAAWLCRCKCGRLSVIRGAFLRRYNERCHCPKRFSPAAKKLQPLYRSIIKRCYDPKYINYSMYGAIGVSVCKRWRDSVEAFAEDIGPRPSPKHVVARRNSRGNYTPANCFWALRADSRRRIGQMITYNGRTKNLAAWAAEIGITCEAMRRRVNRCRQLGLDDTSAITADWKQGRSAISCGKFGGRRRAQD